MRKLLTYLGLLATLLAMPYHAKANNMNLRFWNGAEKVVNMNHDGGNTAWHYDFYTSDEYWKNNREIYVYPRVDDNDNYKMQSWLPEAEGENKSGTEYDFYKWKGNESKNKYDYKITLPSDIATKLYKVTVWVTNYNQNLSDPSCKVKVTWEAVDATNLTLRTDAYNWAAVRYDEYDSGTNTYIWDLTSLSDFTNTSKFKLELAGKWYGNGGTIGGDPVYFTSTGGESTPNIPSTTGNNIARLEAQYDNGWKVRIVSGNAIVKHDYYWVSPQITNGEMWPAFKMVASRNRYYSGSAVIGDGKISNKYYTFTIKDDDLVRWRTKNKIEKDQPIQWYILRDDGEVVYRPKTDLVADYKPNNNVDYDTNHPISGNTDNEGYVSFINYWNGYGGDVYMTTAAPHNEGSWKFLKGSALAHTFNLNAEKGHVLYNYTNKGATTTRGYNLVGNWTAGTKVSIHLSEGKPMKKYRFKGGVGELIADNVEVTDADSIVYKIDITKKELKINSWGGLYLDISPSDNGTDDNDTNWGKVFRPLITTGNNLDGRALHGALTTRKDEQSLNPETSENYLGYTFSFNATTMTYRLEFHTPDATLSPGTMDGNLNFLNSTSETINVKFSNASDGIHTTATKYQIAFGDNEDITFSDDTKYTASSFKLRYEGNKIYKDNETTEVATGNTVFVKIKGWDDNNYGDVHTYQYTFFSPLTFEPKGGLFINSAKIKIQGGAKPYKWTVYKYETKKDEVSGDEVLDLHTERSSGTFDGDYNDTDGKYRISTPGILVIEDKNGNKVISDENNLFDFTYSTSENYDINNNGEDYWKAAPGDLSNKLDLTWGGAVSDVTAVSHWSGEDGRIIKGIDKDHYPLTQTVAGLDPNKTYTVQAIVRGKGEDKATATLTVVGATTGTETINLRNASGGDEGSVEAANLSHKGNVVNKYGRVEYIEPMETDFTQKVEKVGWAKVEAAATPTEDGKLTIELTSTGIWIHLSNVTLLESANTTEGFRTTASATATSVDESTESNGFDFRARDIRNGWKKNNAYSFFDRGKNRNAVIFANERTVIAMNPDLLADVPQNEALKAVDRRHPFNVVGSDENDAKVGTAKALYLTDMGYGGNTTDYPGDADNPVDYDQTGNITGYSRSGYTFIPKFALKAQDVIFDRKLGGESYKPQTTIMLPFEITVTELKKYYKDGLKVWKYNGYNEAKKTILFTEVTGTTEANTPYILTGANGTLDSRKLSSEEKSVKEVAVIQNADQHTANSDGGFTGSYKYQVIPRTATINGKNLTHFAFNPTTGKFQVIHKNGAAMKPFRAYFSVPVEIEENNNAPAFTVIFDDTTTGISESVQVNVEPTNVYTLGGILVARNGDLSRLPKGVYIVNGKKVIK